MQSICAEVISIGTMGRNTKKNLERNTKKLKQPEDAEDLINWFIAIIIIVVLLYLPDSRDQWERERKAEEQHRQEILKLVKMLNEMEKEGTE